MSLSEFDLIARFFSHCGASRKDTLLGVGDDCALLDIPPGKQLAVGIDTLVAGVHFLPDTDPAALGHKALAVNLSDLAAMGAEPAWATLSLTLPSIDEIWLAKFARGFAALANTYGVALVGGDTTRGPLAISVQALGLVDPGRTLRRAGASPGDRIFVTGTLGDAGLALKSLQESSVANYLSDQLRSRLDCPQPRVAEGRALAQVASSAIDVSDGLVSDLGHILEASGVGATLELDRLPLTSAVRNYLAVSEDYSLPLSAGDDYELCFTVAPDRVEEVEDLSRRFACGFTRIGVIDQTPGLRLIQADGQAYPMTDSGYDHFSQ